MNSRAYRTNWRRNRVDKPTETVEDTLPETESVLVPYNTDTFNYRKGGKVAGIAIRGMRDKPMKLRRMQLERLQSFMKGARGLPQYYALQFDKRLVHVWPIAVHDLHFIITYGDEQEEAEGKSA